jgi:ribosomal protein S8
MIYLVTLPRDDQGIIFDCRIFSKTDSYIANWISKNGFIKNYILSESKNLISQFDIIYSQMMDNPEESLRKIRRFRDPKGKIYFTEGDIEKIDEFYRRIKKEK